MPNALENGCPIEIESFKSDDFSIIANFVAAIQEFERQKNSELKPGAEIANAYAAQIIAACNAEHALGSILLAKSAGEAVGFISAWVKEDDDFLLQDKFRRHGYVSDIYVKPENRRSGIARLLLNTIEEEMRQKGCVRIVICSKANNLAALKCYEQNSYEAYEVILKKTL